MGLDERDYVRGKHPPTCTCVECQRKRLARLGLGERKKWSGRRCMQLSFKSLMVWLVIIVVIGLLFVLMFAPESMS